MTKRQIPIRRADRNQPVIAAAARAVGATFQHLHTIGNGCPDAIVGYRGVNYLIEIKDHAKPRSQRKLTEDEIAWHSAWQGQVATIETTDDLYQLIGVI